MKKLSGGIAFLAGLIIVLSLIRLILTQSLMGWFGHLPKIALVLILAYAVLNNIARIIASIFIFKQREWARKLLVISTAIWIFYSAFVLLPVNSHAINNTTSIPMYSDLIDAGYESVSKQVSQEMVPTKEEYTTRVLDVVHRVNIVMQVISILYLCLILFVFTRPGVKAQFIQAPKKDTK